MPAPPPRTAVPASSTTRATTAGSVEVGAVDDDRVLGRPQRAVGPAAVVLVAAAQVLGQGGDLVGVRDARAGRPGAGRGPPATRSGRSSASRRAGRRCRCRGPRRRRASAAATSARCWATSCRRTAGTADTGDTARVTSAPRMRSATSTPSTVTTSRRASCPTSIVASDDRAGDRDLVVQADPGVEHGDGGRAVHGAGVEVGRAQAGARRRGRRWTCPCPRGRRG